MIHIPIKIISVYFKQTHGNMESICYMEESDGDCCLFWWREHKIRAWALIEIIIILFLDEETREGIVVNTWQCGETFEIPADTTDPESRAVNQLHLSACQASCHSLCTSVIGCHFNKSQLDWMSPVAPMTILCLTTLPVFQFCESKVLLRQTRTDDV